MNQVEPIRDLDKLEDMCRYLKQHNERDYVLFCMGLYTGLRVSDILTLRIRDVKDKSQIVIKEKKTGKRKYIEVNPILKKVLRDYTRDKDPDDFLIKSRKNYNRPIGRKRAWKIISDLGDKFGIPHLGSHSMRKTFGYHFYKQAKDVALLQSIFNHASPSITLNYIGINKDGIDAAYRDFRYFN